MEITLTVVDGGETYAYHSNDEACEECADFMDALIGFEGILKAAYPSFEGHGLVAMCPDGSLHEGVDEDGELPPGSEEKKPDADGGINLENNKN